MPAIRGGQFITYAGTTLIHRLQRLSHTLDRARETIYETGNYLTVGDIYETPTVTYEVESFDPTAVFEFKLAGDNYFNPTNTSYAFTDLLKPQTFISPIKDKENQYESNYSVAVPGVTLTEIRYRFAGNENSSQTFTFRGGRHFIAPGKMNYIEITSDGTNPIDVFDASTTELIPTANGNYLLYVERDGEALREGVDYVEIPPSDPDYTLQVNILSGTNPGEVYKFVFATKETVTYPQSIHTYQYSYGSTNYKIPAAVRGRNVIVEFKPFGSATYSKLGNVTSVEITATWGTSETDFVGETFRRIDREPIELTGSITFDFDTFDRFYKFVKEKVMAWNSDYVKSADDLALEGELRITIYDPQNNVALKRLRIQEVRFNVPNLEVSPRDKWQPSFDWISLNGVGYVEKPDTGVRSAI